ncbi:MAG TPA: hypothetical protein DCS87_01165 [Rheinheimera sp.]|nr:hypothetical protein [Rheinheimera sp.]
MKLYPWAVAALLIFSVSNAEAALNLPYQFDQLNQTQLVIQAIKPTKYSTSKHEVLIVAQTGRQKVSTHLTVDATATDEQVLAAARDAAFFYQGDLYFLRKNAGGQCMRCNARDLYKVAETGVKLIGSVGPYDLEAIQQLQQQYKIGAEQASHFDLYNELEYDGLTSMERAPKVQVVVREQGNKLQIDPSYTLQLNQATFEKNLKTINELKARIDQLDQLEKREYLLGALQENLVILRLSADQTRLQSELQQLRSWLDEVSYRDLTRVLGGVTGQIRYTESM